MNQIKSFGDSESVLAPQSFLLTLKPFNFQQKHLKFASHLSNLKNYCQKIDGLGSSHDLQENITEKCAKYYQATLQKFLQYYPFNYSYWIQLLDLLLSQPKGKSNALKMYQVALAKNPRCIQLWKRYLEWLRKQLLKSDPAYLKAQLQNATRVIGNMYHSGFVYEMYLEIQPQAIKKYDMCKRALLSPIADIDKIKEYVFKMIDAEEFNTIIVLVAERERLQMQSSVSFNSIQKIDSIKEKLKLFIQQSLYAPTKAHIGLREQYQLKIITTQYVPYKQSASSLENWKSYIGFIKNSGNPQFLSSIYQRALISQCDNEALWEEYFSVLENEGNHARALYMLRFHSLFFRSLSKQLTFYWLEIEQRDNPSHARQLYLQIQHQLNDIHSLQQSTQMQLCIFLRHIQMELRSKEFQNVKNLYETLLTLYTSNIAVLSYLLLQYCQFLVKCFRDVQYSKKLLLTYFRSYPFYQHLFMGLLDFYDKYIQHRKDMPLAASTTKVSSAQAGSKESKEIVDQFIEIALLGLKKAYQKYLPMNESNQFSPVASQNQTIAKNEYNLIKKIVCYRLRAYVNSIYLIKAAERKIKQQQFALKKQCKQLANAKRDREPTENNQIDNLNSTSKRI